MTVTEESSGPAGDPNPDTPLLDLLAGFISELRNAGLPVSLTENLDAMEAVTHIPLEDRDAFKYALGATLVKNHAHWRAFEVVFEVYFAIRGDEYVIPGEAEAGDSDDGTAQPGEGTPQGGGGGSISGLTPEQLAEMLMRALMNGDQAMMRVLARQAVIRYAGMEPGRPVGGTYYLYRTLRNLDLDDILERLMATAGEEAAGGAVGTRRVQRPHRAAETGDRRRDQAVAGGGPRCRGHGPHAPQAAARGCRLHARIARGDGQPPQGDLSAHPETGRAPGPEAAPRP
jgi:uncharacterized protein with von Willebrand factor type A (vWA) domain